MKSPGLPRALAGGVLAGVAAAVLWRYNRRQVSVAERRHPPTGRFVDVDGARLHLTLKGQGPPVLLLHGAAGTLRDFDALCPLLATRYTVVALDRPGHGYSDPCPSSASTADAQVPLVRALLDRLGLERPIIVGYSGSAALALAYALRHPAGTAGLVLVGGTTHEGDEPRNLLYWMLRTPGVANALIGLGLIPIGRSYIARPLARAFAPDRPPPAYMDVARNLWVRPAAVHAMTEDFRTLGRTLERIRPLYSELRVPVVALSGDADRLVDHGRNSVRFVREAPGAELMTVHGAGHALPQLRPELVARAVDRVQELRTLRAGERRSGSGS